ncbi:MAG: diacylglycerol kinase family lipid kinase [Xanthomonadales bacterium]|nr:diacylglycerol kinase family lipid kinase [Xanthomonadales bacterium]
MRLLLVFNPRAAAGRSGKLLAEIVGRLECFAAVDVLQSAGAGEACRQVAHTDLSVYDGVVAAGGDGTLFAALNGLYRHPLARRPPLGVIPAGTGNAFARDLGLRPDDWRKAIGIIEAGGLRALDVGQVQTPTEAYFFLNIVGVGLPVDAMRTARRLKGLGLGAYTLAVLWQVLKLKTHRFMLEIDGEDFSGEYVFAEISNTRYTGTSFLIAPQAVPVDGLLDVTLLRPLRRRRLLRLFPTIYRGGHTAYAEVLSLRGRKLSITAPQAMTLAPDGEFRGATPATIRCLHRDLRFFWSVSLD